MMILTLAQRELRSLFLSPLAWAILAVTQFILAYLFLTSLNDFITLQPRLQSLDSPPGATELVVAPLYGSAAFIFMMVVPLLTMRIISEERRNRSIALLFSAPVSMTEIILGKYLGLLGFLFLATLMISLMPLTLYMGGPLDTGLLLAMILALFLLLACFAAIGLFLSTLTMQPTIAAISTFGALLLLWIIDWAGGQVDESVTSGLLEYLSILRHFESLSQGLFSSTDVIYFALFITVFLVLGIRRLDADRLQH